MCVRGDITIVIVPSKPWFGVLRMIAVAVLFAAATLVVLSMLPVPQGFSDYLVAICCAALVSIVVVCVFVVLLFAVRAAYRTGRKS